MKKFCLFFLILAVLMVIGCASTGRIPKAEDPLDVGPLAKILVFLSDVPLGETGPSPIGASMDVGGVIYLTAQGRDSNNKPIKITPAWTASKPGIVEITPATAAQGVSVKGLRSGTVDIVVEALGVKHIVGLITVK
jgi:hypothetical protein